jgi:inosine/xanthosine triphosphatase
MKIGIGSNNRTKIEACKSAIEKLITAFNYPLEIESVIYYHRETQTSVPDMPLERNESITGARERAFFVHRTLLKEDIQIDYAIGLEGAVYQLPKKSQTSLNAFFENWVFVYNGSTGFYGSSSALPLPKEIQNDLYKNRIELADIIDRFSGKHDVRSNEGAFGILTNNLVKRSQSFESAIINAFIPFFNKKYRI